MKITRKRLVISSILSIFFVYIFLFESFSNVTGYSIINRNLANVSSIFAAIFLIITTLLSAAILEKKVGVYDQSKGKMGEEEQRYHITDPEMYFGTKTSAISLSQFRREIQQLKKDSELIEVVQESYGPQLLEILKSSDKEERRVAEKFLEVLYSPEKLREINESNQPVLNAQSREEIKNAFKGGWKGEPNIEQREVMKKYGLSFLRGSKHGRIYSVNHPEIFERTSLTPSDMNAGRQVGREVVRLIERQYELY